MGRHPEPLSPELCEISELMRAQAADRGGVITAAQCRPFGADPAVIRRLLRSGRWRRARRGVYRAALVCEIATPVPRVATRPAHRTW